MSEYLGDCIILKQEVIHILPDLHLLAKIGAIILLHWHQQPGGWK